MQAIAYLDTFLVQCFLDEIQGGAANTQSLSRNKGSGDIEGSHCLFEPGGRALIYLPDFRTAQYVFEWNTAIIENYGYSVAGFNSKLCFHLLHSRPRSSSRHYERLHTGT